jgi:hypothetical protein
MFESNLEMLNGRVPEVKPDDIARVWSVLESEKERSRELGLNTSGAAVGICYRLLAEKCDVHYFLAVFLRVALINGLLQDELLDRWRSEGGLNSRVFEVAAAFPLSRGLEDVDSGTFIRALE